MAQIETPNILGSFLQGQQAGQEQRTRRTLADFLQPALGGDQAALSRVYAADPNAGLQVQGLAQKNSAADREAKVSNLQMLAKAYPNAPEAIKAQLYGQIVDLTEGVGLAPAGSLPRQHDPALDANFTKFLSGISGAEDGYTLSPGGKRFDNNNQLVAEAPFAPEKPQFQTDADGNGWWIAPGQAPRPVSDGGAAPQANIGSAIDMSAIGSSLDTLAGLDGVTQTSRLRTPERNAAVGGQPNSQHLRGTAGDYVVPQAQKAEFMRRAESMGLTAIDEGDHIHVQGPRGGQAQAGGLKFPTKGNASTEDKAANWQIIQGNDGAFYRTNKLTGVVEPVGVTGSNAARVQKMEQERLEKVQGIQGSIAQTQTALDSIDTLLSAKGLDRAVGIGSIFPTAPGSDSANFEAQLDTFKAQTFVPMVAQLKGMGALSDAEGKKLSEAVGALNIKMSPSAFRSSLNNIKKVLNDAKTRANQKISDINKTASGTYRAPQQAAPTDDDEALIGKYANG